MMNNGNEPASEMTKRERFAMAAMQTIKVERALERLAHLLSGKINMEDRWDDWEDLDIAELSTQRADALLAELEKRDG